LPFFTSADKLTIAIKLKQPGGGFTLLEICLAIFIALLIVTMTIPSIQGILAAKGLRESFENFDSLVQQARILAVTDQTPYLLVWDKDGVSLDRQEAAESKSPLPRLEADSKTVYDLALPATLIKDPPREWIFWPTGTCEPAVVTGQTSAGTWTATYDPLTVSATTTDDQQ
jgi:type II secretory pathway pseudopilin PulG